MTSTIVFRLKNNISDCPGPSVEKEINLLSVLTRRSGKFIAYVLGTTKSSLGKYERPSGTELH